MATGPNEDDFLISPDELDRNLIAAKNRVGLATAQKPDDLSWGEYLAGKLPFVGSAIRGEGLLNVYEAAERVNAGKGTQSDFNLLREYAHREQQAANRGFWAGAGDITLGVIPMGVEFAATGGAFSGTKKLIQEALEGGAKKVAKTAAGKAIKGVVGDGVAAKAGSMAGTALKTTAGVTGGLAAQTAAQPQAIAERMMQRVAPTVSLSEDDRGVVHALIEESDEGFVEAMGKGALDAGIEIASERAGEALGLAARGLGKAAGWAMDKTDFTKGLKAAIVSRFLSKGGTVENLNNKLKAFGWHGLFGEMFEERVGDVSRGATGVEEDYGTVGKLVTNPFDGSAWRQLAQEAVAFAIPGVATGVAGRIADRGKEGENELPVAEEAEAGQPGVPPEKPEPSGQPAAPAGTPESAQPGSGAPTVAEPEQAPPGATPTTGARPGSQPPPLPTRRSPVAGGNGRPTPPPLPTSRPTSPAAGGATTQPTSPPTGGDGDTRTRISQLEQQIMAAGVAAGDPLRLGKIQAAAEGKTDAEYLGLLEGAVRGTAPPTGPASTPVATASLPDGVVPATELEEIAPEDVSGPQGTQQGWRKIGVNSAGAEVYEDHNGVRSYVSDGVRVTEGVTITPRGHSVDKDRRGPEYKTVEETATVPAPASSPASTSAGPADTTTSPTEPSAPARKFKDYPIGTAVMVDGKRGVVTGMRHSSAHMQAGKVVPSGKLQVRLSDGTERTVRDGEIEGVQPLNVERAKVGDTVRLPGYPKNENPAKVLEVLPDGKYKVFTGTQRVLSAREWEIEPADVTPADIPESGQTTSQESSAEQEAGDQRTPAEVEAEWRKRFPEKSAAAKWAPSKAEMISDLEGKESEGDTSPGALVDKYYPKAKRMAKKWARRYPRADLDALLSDAGLALRNAAEKFDPARGVVFSTYAYKAVKRALDRAANVRRREEQSDAAMGGATSTEASPDAAAEKKDQQQRLQRAISQLSDADQDIIRRQMAGESMETIGKAHNLTHQGVSRRVNRIQRTLAAILAYDRPPKRLDDKRPRVDDPPAGGPETRPYGFVSGFQRSPSDIQAARDSGRDIGVAVLDGLSKNVQQQLVTHLNNGGRVFVDSGAFTAFTSGLRGNPREVDWEKTLDLYEQLAYATAAGKRRNLFLIAPDVVGDPAATEELQGEHQASLDRLSELGVSLVVPIQKQDGKDLITSAADLSDRFDLDSIVIGIPFNKAAFSAGEVIDLVRRNRQIDGVDPLRIHLLGAGEAKVSRLYEQVHDADPTVVLSGDASMRERARKLQPERVPPVRAGDAYLKELPPALAKAARRLPHRILRDAPIRGVIQGRVESELPDGADAAVFYDKKTKMLTVFDAKDANAAYETQNEIIAAWAWEHLKPEEYSEWRQAVGRQVSGDVNGGTGGGMSNVDSFAESVIGWLDGKPWGKSAAVLDKLFGSQVAIPDSPLAFNRLFFGKSESEIRDTWSRMWSAWDDEQRRDARRALRDIGVDWNNSRTLENNLDALMEHYQRSGDVPAKMRDVASMIEGDARLRSEDLDVRSAAAQEVTDAIREKYPELHFRVHDLASWTAYPDEARDAIEERLRKQYGDLSPRPADTGGTQDADGDADLEAAILKAMQDSGVVRRPKRVGDRQKPPATDPFAGKRAAPRPKRDGVGPKAEQPAGGPAKSAARKRAEDAFRAAFADIEEDDDTLAMSLSGAAAASVDPQKIQVVVALAKAAMEDQITDFPGFVGLSAELIGRKKTLKIATYLEMAWRVLKKSEDYRDRIGPVGKVSDILGRESQEPSDDRTDTRTSGGDQGRSASDRRGGPRGQEPSDAGNGGELEGVQSQDVPEPETPESGVGLRDGDGDAVHREDDSSGADGKDESVRRGAGVRGDAADDLGAGRGRGNYHLTDPQRIVGGSQREKFERNRRAIEIAHEIEIQNREPTQEEMDILASYMGWGGFGQELFQGSWSDPRPMAGWEDADEWLREHLGEAGWRSAQMSITNAHYTDPDTVQAMWDMARRMGFDGGRVLEPSMGVGNFFALMPRDMMARSSLTGIELDTTSAMIAKTLYPDANIQQKGYEQSKTPDNFYDLVISNVPFGRDKPADRRYDSFQASIHNFFFLKAVDQVKPGGLVMFLTTNTTMDGKASARRIRRELEKKADFVAAYRLPSGAFQRYANTKVVADLIILRKRHEGEETQSPPWDQIVKRMTRSGTEVEVNEYWDIFPENILGTLNYGHGTTTGRPGMIVDPPADLGAEMQQAISRLPEQISNTRTAPSRKDRIRANDTRKRQGSIVLKNRHPYVVRGEHLVPLEEEASWVRGKSPEKVEARVKEIEMVLAIRDALADVLDAQSRSEDAEGHRDRLRKAYHKFAKVYGSLYKSPTVPKLMKKVGDPMAYAVINLEEVRHIKKGSLEQIEIRQRPIFDRNTVRQRKQLDKLSISDAYVTQRNEQFVFDANRVAELAKTTPEAVIAELESKKAIYKTADGTWEPADLYIAGNVRRKRRELLAAMREGVGGLEESLKAIEAVVPVDIPYTDIEANLGATFVESSDYAAFLGHLLNTPADEFIVERLPGKWIAKNDTGAYHKPEAMSIWGHPQVPFGRMIEAAMNNGDVKVWDKDADGTSFVNETATREANEKVDGIREEFKNWIWSNQERATRLADAYNETFNAFHTPTYNGDHLQFDGLMLEMGNSAFDFRKHQRDAVWRGLVTGRGLYAHEVGTGKTFTIGALAIESRRLGLANKPVLFAHNGNSLAVYRDIQAAYPGAKVLYIDNLSPANRDAAIAQISLDDWDLVVIPHSLVNRFELKPETVRDLVADEMAALEAAAREAVAEDQSGWGSNLPDNLDTMSDADISKIRNYTAKELVKSRKQLADRIARAAHLADAGNTVFFEDMGIDMLLVDEAHIFKKIPLSTKQKVKGLNRSGSERGIMMSLLADYTRRINNGRGVHLFTGTPITNTLNEVYNMQRMVMAEIMDRDGVKDWDPWFSTFADSVSDVELTSGGTWDVATRLSAFHNLPELRQMFGQYLDIVFADDMPEFRPREEREGLSSDPVGRPYKEVHLEIADQTEEQLAETMRIRHEYDHFKKADGKTRRQMMLQGQGPLQMEGRGVKNALDPRLVDMNIVGNHPDLKCHRVVKNAMMHYHEHPKSTQMIFFQTGYSDTVTRKESDGAGGKREVKYRVFNLAKEIKRLLIEQGVKPEEIVIFPDLDTGLPRKAAADAMREGKVRFAIGNTDTMGTGVNAQDYLRAIHHLDAPWTPGDFEQRNGRGHRQGNHWNTIHEYRYLQEGSHDGRRWQVMLIKHRFINDFLRNKNLGRVLEGDATDLSEEGGDMFSDTFSAAAGDPRILLRAKLAKDVEKLERAKHRHARNVSETQHQLERQQARAENLAKEVSLIEQDIRTLEANHGAFAMTILGKTYEDRKEAKDALMKAGETYAGRVGRKEIGSYRGMRIVVVEKDIVLASAGQYTVKWSPESIDGTLRNLPGRLKNARDALDGFVRFAETAKAVIGSAFPREEDLRRKREQLAAIEAEMAANPEPSPSWLRNGAVPGTMLYYNGVEREVVGHRGSDTILVDDGHGGMEPIPAKEAADEYGTPIFPHLSKHGGDTTLAMATTLPRRTPPQGTNPTRMPMSKTPKAATQRKPEISAARIIATLERIFGVPIRTEGFRRRAEAIYKVLPKIIRMKEKNAANLLVAMHEISHHLDHTYHILPFKKHPGLAPTRAILSVGNLDHQGQGNAVEGFAEFIRILVSFEDVDVNGTPTPAAKVWAREFYDWFTADFLPKHPEAAQKLDEARRYIRQFADQPVLARLNSLFQPKRDLSATRYWEKKMRSAVMKIRRGFTDWAAPLDVVDKVVEQAGRKVDVKLHDMAQFYHMTEGANAAQALEEGVHDVATGEKIGSVSVSGLKRHLKNDSEYQEVRAYMVARHTVYMAQQKPGYFTGAEYDWAVDWLDYVSKDRGRHVRFEKFARELAQFNNDLLRMLVNAGAISHEEYDQMLKYYGPNGEYYLPLHRQSEKGMFAGIKGYVNLRSPVHRRSRSGSGQPLIDPIDATIGRAIHFYKRAAQARVATTLAENLDPLLGGIEGAGGIMDRVPPKQIVHTGVVDEILQTLVDEGIIEADSARDMHISVLIRNGGRLKPADLQWFATRHGVDLANSTNIRGDLLAACADIPDALATIHLWRPDYSPIPRKKIARIALPGGKMVMYQMEESLHDTMTGVSGVQLMWFEKILAKASRAFKTGAVGLNPAFAVGNVIRDYGEYQGKATTGLESVIDPAAKLIGYAAYAMGDKKTSKHALYQMFDEAGGRLYSAIGPELAQRKRVRQRLLGKSTMSRFGLTVTGEGTVLGHARDAIVSGLDAAQGFMAISDAPPRLAELEAAIREEGYEVRGDRWYHRHTNTYVDHLPEHVRIKGMTRAANATVNFKQFGAYRERIETYFPFANAAIQAALRQGRQIAGLRRIGEKGEGRRQAVRYLIYLSLLASAEMIHWATRHDDDDYIEDEWQNDVYWTYGWNGKTYLRIAKPRNDAIFGNIVRTMLNGRAGSDRDGIGKMLARDILNRVPTGGGLIRGSFEVLTDYDYFRQRRLTPMSEEPKPGSLQSTAYTSSASKWLAGVMASATGDRLEMSPIRMDHLLDSASGGYYSWATGVWDDWHSGDGVTGNLSWEDIPGVKAVAVNRHQSGSVDDFYEAVRDVEHRRDHEAARDGVRPETAKELRRLDTYMALMTAIRDLDYDDRGRRRHEYEPYIVGLARKAMGRDPLPHNPDPFMAEDLPKDVRAIVEQFTNQQVKTAVLQGGKPNLQSRYRENAKTAAKTDAEVEAKYEADLGLWQERVQAATDFLMQNRRSPIVQAVLERERSKLLNNPPALNGRERAEDFAAYNARQHAWLTQLDRAYKLTSPSQREG